MLNDVREITEKGIRKKVEIPDNWLSVRKKPITVHAIQMYTDFEVETLEGVHIGHAGDYLMKGIHGELYCIKKDIFEQTYDIVRT